MQCTCINLRLFFYKNIRVTYTNKIFVIPAFILIGIYNKPAILILNNKAVTVCR